MGVSAKLTQPATWSQPLTSPCWKEQVAPSRPRLCENRDPVPRPVRAPRRYVFRRVLSSQLIFLPSLVVAYGRLLLKF